MSFRSSIVGLAHLVQKVLAEAGEACGKQNEFTIQISSLQNVLNRLQQESANPKSGIFRANKTRKKELEEYIKRCKDILRVLDAIFIKYNSLTDEKKHSRKIWRKVKFVNGETRHLTDIRLELSALTAVILISIRLSSLKSLGKVDARLGRIESHSNSRQLQGLRRSLHWITASKAALGGEGPIWTYVTNGTNDNEDFWRDIRRQLIKEGYDRTVIKKHTKPIQSYVTELGNRGVFDGLEQKKAQYIYIPGEGQHKDELSYTSKEPKHKGTAQSFLTRSTTTSNSLSTSSNRVETLIDERLLHTGNSEVHDISISGEASSFEAVIQPLQGLDLRPTSEPIQSNLDFEFLPNSPTDSTFVLSDDIEISKAVPTSTGRLVHKNRVPSAKFEILPEEKCLVELASAPLADTTHPEPLMNAHSPSENNTRIGSNSQLPSIISQPNKPTSPKQVRFADSEINYRTVLSTKSSQATRKLPSSVRRLRDHFPFNNLSVTKY